MAKSKTEKAKTNINPALKSDAIEAGIKKFEGKELARVEARTHAECSPSQLKRLMLCPGARRKRLAHAQYLKDKGYALDSSSAYALEGEMLHHITELRIVEGLGDDLKELLTYDSADHEEELPELTREQNTAVEECVDYFGSVIRELSLTTIIKSIKLETHGGLDYMGLPEVAGYVDLRIESEDRIDVIDWKFGQGVAVMVEDNPQLLAYGGCSFSDTETLKAWPEVVLHIVQPRLNYFECAALSGLELYEWIEYTLKPIIEETRKPTADCVPGAEQCRWCVGPLCKERAEKANADAVQVFAQYTTPNNFVPIEEVLPLYHQATRLNAYIKDLTALIYQLCNTPEGCAGFKIVEGRGSRTWRDTQAAIDYLTPLADNPQMAFDFDDLYETKFVSVSKAEKLDKSIKKAADFKALYVKHPGKPTLALDSDPRPAIKDTAANAFAAFIDQDKD